MRNLLNYYASYHHSEVVLSFQRTQIISSVSLTQSTTVWRITVAVLDLSEFRTRRAAFPATIFTLKEVNLWMVSVGYESFFLVNPSLLCLHQFCVVMSEYLTVFHLNIV